MDFLNYLLYYNKPNVSALDGHPCRSLLPHQKVPDFNKDANSQLDVDDHYHSDLVFQIVYYYLSNSGYIML